MMITVERKREIDSIIGMFKIIWYRHPDLRFGQLYYNLTHKSNIHIFYIEDEHFIKMMLETEL